MAAWEPLQDGDLPGQVVDQFDALVSTMAEWGGGNVTLIPRNRNEQVICATAVVEVDGKYVGVYFDPRPDGDGMLFATRAMEG